MITFFTYHFSLSKIQSFLLIIYRYISGDEKQGSMLENIGSRRYARHVEIILIMNLHLSLIRPEKIVQKGN